MSKSASVAELLMNAKKSGAISPPTAIVLANCGADIERGLGVAAMEVKASDVGLLGDLLDDSGSIRFNRNAEIVREGRNGMLDAVGGAKKRDDLLVYTMLLNGGVLNPYSPLASAIRLDTHNYNPGGETPLYKQAAAFLGTVLLKADEFAQNGVPCRTISVIFTDGGDNASGRVTAADVAKITADMYRSEAHSHLIFAFGVDDGTTDHRRVFTEMGIPPEFILTSANDPREIRQKFQLMSRSAAHASQNAQSFSKVQQQGLGAFTK